jgi:uncharacterized membrane protein
MNNHRSITKTVPRLALWCAVAILAVIGIAAAIGRVASVANGGSTYDQISAVLPAEAVQEAHEFDHWFVAHPALTMLHVIPGAILLALAPFQFSSSIRTRYVRFHRWSGRVLVLAALLAGLSGLLLGALFPYGGADAASAVFVAGALFLFALTRAFIAIRRQDVRCHREWMIRMFSIGIGISTVRVIGLVVYAITGASFEVMAGASFWLGWSLTFAAAELWIRHTRPQRIALSDATVTATGD